MNASNLPRSRRGDKATTHRAQQRALVISNFPNHPLAHVSDATFEALMEDAVFFDGPVVAVVNWIAVSGEVDAMIAMGMMFGPWFAAAGFLYGIYKEWQQEKQNKATAKMIIQKVIAAGE